MAVTQGHHRIQALVIVCAQDTCTTRHTQTTPHTQKSLSYTEKAVTKSHCVQSDPYAKGITVTSPHSCHYSHP